MPTTASGARNSAASVSFEGTSASTCTAGILVSRNIAIDKRCSRPRTPRSRSSSSRIISARCRPAGAYVICEPKYEHVGPLDSGDPSPRCSETTATARMSLASAARAEAASSSTRITCGSAPIRPSSAAGRPGPAPPDPRRGPSCERLPDVTRRRRRPPAGVDRDHRATDLALDRSELFSLSDEAAAEDIVERSHPLQRRQRVQPGNSVGIIADVSLEVADGGLGLGSVHAVLLAGIEPECVEFALQRTHVVSPQVGPVDEQRSVAEPEPRLDELAPRVRADEPVDVEMALGLEGAHGLVRGGPERAALAGREFVAEIGQPQLDVDDLGAVVAPPVDPHDTVCARPDAPATNSGEMRAEIPKDRVLRLRTDHACDLLAV